MLGTEFQHNTMTNLVRAFGDLFNNIPISYKNNDGNVINKIIVPIEYAPRKFVIGKAKEAIKNGDISRYLPRMSHEISSISYASDRKLQTQGKIVKKITGDNTQYNVSFNPVPYDIILELNILTNNTFDALKIVEQILPFFTPSFTIPMYETDLLQIRRDIPITLNSISPNDEYQSGESGDERFVRWTLDFSAKMNFYGPVSKQNVITKAITQLYPNTVNLDADAVDSNIVNSTFRSEIVPDPTSANISSEFDYSTTITTFED